MKNGQVELEMANNHTTTLGTHHSRSTDHGKCQADLASNKNQYVVITATITTVSRAARRGGSRGNGGRGRGRDSRVCRCTAKAFSITSDTTTITTTTCRRPPSICLLVYARSEGVAAWVLVGLGAVVFVDVVNLPSLIEQ